MARKLVSVLLAVCLMASPAMPAFAETQQMDDLIAFVSHFNIINGDPGGNYRLNDLVTRAEFTKVAVAASSFRNSVATSLTVSPFQDVSYQHWAAPYIKVALSNGIISGYEDSTFRPDNTVSFEEAVTIFLKLLGYTNDDFGSSWPYGQVGLANNIKLTEQIEKGVGDALNREDVIRLTYNLLNTKMKDSDLKYVDVFDCAITDDVILIATSNEDASVSADKVVTSAGTFLIGDDFDYNDVGRKGSITVKDGDELICFIPNDQQVTEYTVTATMGSDLVFDGTVLNIDENMATYYKSQQSTYSQVVPSAKKGDVFKVFANQNGIIDYTLLIPQGEKTDFDTADMEKKVVYSVMDNKIITYENGVFDEFTVGSNVTMYEDDTLTSYSAIQAKMAIGDILNVRYDKNGEIDYIVYSEGDLKGPITVTGSSWQSAFGVDTSGLTVMRDGVKSSLDEIKTYDVVYYSDDLGMLLAYSKKVTGVYESASPNRDMPNTVTVSGVQYDLEGVTAFNKLSSSGDFIYGDTITLLIGRNGEVADAISAETAVQNVVGYVTETGSKTYLDNNNNEYSSFYVELALTDGTTSEYKTQKNYKDYLNSVVSVTFDDSYAKLDRKTGDSTVYGKVNANALTLGEDDLSKDVEILEVSTTYSDEVGAYKKQFLQRLDGMEVKSGSVVFAGKNAAGEIERLVLEDATGDLYTYAVVTSVQTRKADGSGSYQYQFDAGGTTYVDAGRYLPVSSGAAAKLTLDETNAIARAQSLTKIDNITSVSSLYVGTKSQTTYKVSSEVLVYTAQSSGAGYKYLITPIDDIAGNEDQYNITAYSDKSEALGGRVRVIIAWPKG